VPFIPKGSLPELVEEENQAGSGEPRFTWKMAVKMDTEKRLFVTTASNCNY